MFELKKPEMKFGLFNLMSLRDNPGGMRGVIADTEAMISLAEDIGFDIAWFAEHHFTNYSISCSPLMMAAHFASRTQKIRLGTAVIVLPLYQPMRVAQEIGLVDQLSGGRLVLGVGSGYQPYEFDRLGADVAVKTEMFLEYWEVIQQAIEHGFVDFGGKYVREAKSVVGLRPLNPNILSELYLTSMDPRVIARLSGLNPIPFFTAGWRGSPALPGIIERARNAWDVGMPVKQPMPVAIQQYICVTESHAEARQAAEHARFVGRAVDILRNRAPSLVEAKLKEEPVPNELSLEEIQSNLIIGDAHYVAQRLVEEIKRFSPVHYNYFFQFGDMPRALALSSLERFGKSVLPLVRSAMATA